MTKNDDVSILNNLVFIFVWRNWNKENNVKNDWLIISIIWDFVYNFSYFNDDIFKNDWRDFNIIVIFLCCLVSLYCMFCKNQQKEFCVKIFFDQLVVINDLLKMWYLYFLCVRFENIKISQVLKLIFLINILNFVFKCVQFWLKKLKVCLNWLCWDNIFV